MPATARVGDIRQAAYDLAERMHQDRLGCLARHFEQYYRGPGDPDVEHAQHWLHEQIDPTGIFRPTPAELPLPTEPVTYNGTSKTRPVTVMPSGERRVGGNTAIAPGSDPPRGSFLPANAEEFMAASAQASLAAPQSNQLRSDTAPWSAPA